MCCFSLPFLAKNSSNFYPLRKPYVKAARIAFDGSKRAAFWTYAIVYGLFAFLGNASYLLVLGTCVSDAARHPGLLGYEVCGPVSSAFACLAMAPLVVSVRRLTESRLLCYANLALIVLALAICLVKIHADGHVDGAKTHFAGGGGDTLAYFGSMGNILYAFTGHWMYFELIAEMKQPETFPKVFYINAPLQFGLYLSVTTVGYYYLGDKASGYLPDSLPAGSDERLAVSVLLFCHIAVAYLIKSINLCRFVCSLIAPRSFPLAAGHTYNVVKNDGGPQLSQDFVADRRPQRLLFGYHRCGAIPGKRLLYSMTALAFLAAGWVVANAIPVFDELLGLIGSLLSGPISILLPIIFYLLALRKSANATSNGENSSSPTSAQMAKLPASPASSPHSVLSWMSVLWRLYLHALSTSQQIIVAIITTITIIIMIFGTADEVRRIVNDGSFDFGC